MDQPPQEKKIRTATHIVAVGYEVNFAGIADFLTTVHPHIKEILGDPQMHPEKWTVLSGTHYAQNCRGMNRSDQSEQQELTLWFRKKRPDGQSKPVRVRTLHVSTPTAKRPLPDIIAGEFQNGSERFYCFLFNPEKKATGVQKKLINSGHEQFREVSIPDNLRVLVRPYIHNIIHREEITRWIDDDGTDQGPRYIDLPSEQQIIFS